MSKIETKDGIRYVGIYPGIVLQDDSSEPFNLQAGKIKVAIPELHGNLSDPDKLPWTLPCFPTTVGKNSGLIYVPNINDWVWIIFEAGNPDCPVYLGGFCPSGSLPKDAVYGQGFIYPRAIILRTTSGQMIRLVDKVSLEIFLGTNGDPPPGAPPPGTSVPSDYHQQYDTVIRMSLLTKKLEITSKYRLDIRSKEQITLNAPNVHIEASELTSNSGKPIVNDSGDDADGNQVILPLKGTVLELKCTDSSGATGGFSPNLGADGQPDGTFSPVTLQSKITILPGSIKAKSKSISGFNS